jgi:hypothetical protein
MTFCLNFGYALDIRSESTRKVSAELADLADDGVLPPLNKNEGLDRPNQDNNNPHRFSRN